MYKCPTMCLTKWPHLPSPQSDLFPTIDKTQKQKEAEEIIRMNFHQPLHMPACMRLAYAKGRRRRYGSGCKPSQSRTQCAWLTRAFRRRLCFLRLQSAVLCWPNTTLRGAIELTFGRSHHFISFLLFIKSYLSFRCVIRHPAPISEEGKYSYTRGKCLFDAAKKL